MKQIICILLVVTTALIPCLNMQGQEDAKKWEIGIRLESFNNFNFIYKKHRFDEKYLRFRVGNLSFTNQFSETTTSMPQQTIVVENSANYNVSMGFSLGWENRKSLTNELWFVHGFEPGVSFAYRLQDFGSENRTIFSATPYLGYILGFQYDLSEKLYVGIESIPRYYVAYQISNIGNLSENVTIRNGGSFGLDAIAFNVVYRFSK